MNFAKKENIITYNEKETDNLGTICTFNNWN